MSMSGPTTPEEVILQCLRNEARQELISNERLPKQKFEFDPFRAEIEDSFENKVEALADSRLQKTMAEAGLS